MTAEFAVSLVGTPGVGRELFFSAVGVIKCVHFGVFKFCMLRLYVSHRNQEENGLTLSCPHSNGSCTDGWLLRTF